MPAEPTNHREFTRVPVHCHATVLAQGQPVPCTAITTLSLNGMYAETQQALPGGTECEITISLLEHEIEIGLLATVVRNYPDGIAFKFTKILGPESYEHLRNLVLYNASDTDQVESEFETHAGIKRKDQELP